MSAKRHVISCRVSDDEYKDITKVANQLNLKKSNILKLSLMDNLGKYRPINLTQSEKRSMEQHRKKALDLLAKLSTTASDLSRKWLLAGNNLNQIAHQSNKQGDKINFVLIDAIDRLTHQLSSKQLIKQNRKLIKGITITWQLLE